MPDFARTALMDGPTPPVDVPPDWSEEPTWSERHPDAAELAALPPGFALAARLTTVSVPDLDGAALVELVAAGERLASWAMSLQASAVAELARREATVSHGDVDHVADDVAAALAVPRRTAQGKLALAQGLGRLPEVHDALACGAVDLRKAETLVRETEQLPDAVARTVVAGVLPTAPTRTAPQLRAAVRDAELRLDPEAGRQRHARARRERCVRLTPAPDSMAWVTAFLPADDAVVVMTALDGLAASCSPADDRPVDARRADGLVDLARSVLDSGRTPDGAALRSRHGRRPHLELTISAAALAGVAETPGHLAGYGLVPASMIRRLAQAADWRAVVAHPGTGDVLPVSTDAYRPGAALQAFVLRRDVTCRFPGCRVPAARCDLDHVRPFTSQRPADEQTTADNLHALCRHHHRLKTLGLWTVERDATSGVTRWVSRHGHAYTRDPEGPPPDPPWLTPRTGPPTVAADEGERRDEGERGDIDEAVRSVTDRAERGVTERAERGVTEEAEHRTGDADPSDARPPDARPPGVGLPGPGHPPF